jgi:predicted nucleic acid-binding Zn ribbon protein
VTAPAAGRGLPAGATLRNELTLELLGIAPMERVTREYLIRHGYRQPPARCGNGHDLAPDEAMFCYADHTGMRWRCRVCVSERNAKEAKRRKNARKAMRKVNPGKCVVCGASYSGSVNRRTCSDACRDKLCAERSHQRRLSGVWTESQQLVFSQSLMDLMVERDRCATHWERAKIDERIAELRATRPAPAANAARKP